MTRARLATGAVALAVALGVLAWALREPTLPPGVVLRVGTRDYEIAEVARELPDPAQLSVDGAEARLRAFADRVLVAHEAQKQGLHPGTALWELGRDSVAPVTDADLRRAYDARRSEFRHPLRVQLAYAAVPRDAGGVPARERIEAVHVRAQLHPAPGQERFWVPQRMAGGVALQTGPLPCDGSRPRGSALPEEVLAVACSLEVGELSAPIETDDAYFLVKPIWFEPARDVSLREARGLLRRRLENEARDRAQLRVLAALRREVGVVVSRREVAAWLEAARASAPAPAPRDERPPRPPDADTGGST